MRSSGLYMTLSSMVLEKTIRIQERFQMRVDSRNLSEFPSPRLATGGKNKPRPPACNTLSILPIQMSENPVETSLLLFSRA